MCPVRLQGVLSGIAPETHGNQDALPERGITSTAKGKSGTLANPKPSGRFGDIAGGFLDAPSHPAFH